ncbi:MAG: c-type cytochrome biogenesis protein CcmI [Hahellaceae bacterium]|nr:c-type cytochrome biogenesis protein CcmI [Hahellaceae bacterium]
MTLFWISLGAIAFIALVSLVVPILGLSRQREGRATQARESLNVQLFRERQAELEQDLVQGIIDAEKHTQLVAELKQSLLSDVPTGMTVAPVGRTFGYSASVLLLLVVVGLPIGAWSLYTRIGSADAVADAVWVRETHAIMESASDMKDMLARLQTRVNERPDNLEGRILLGRAHMAMQNFESAAESFALVASMLDAMGENPAPALGMQAQALFLQKDEVTAAVRTAVEAALKAYPEEGNALSILGIDAFKQGRYQEAIGYWQRVIATDPDSSNSEALKAGIEKARSLLASTEPQAEPSESDSAAGGAQLVVTVSLDESLVRQVQGDETVFILARPAAGGRMPLAVARVSVRDLPITVTLNDSMAMGPMAKLSSVDQAEVIARVSRSGQPIPQSGDLEGSAGTVKVGGTVELAVTIDKALP